DRSPRRMDYDTLAGTKVSGGLYRVTGVPLRDYLLKVVPDTAGIPDGKDYIPAYYHPNFNRASWKWGAIISVRSDITLPDMRLAVSNPTPLGRGQLGALVNISYDPNGRTTASWFAPMVGMDVYLYLAGTEDLVRAGRTDTLGQVNFDQLDESAAYDLWADFPGTAMDPATSTGLSVLPQDERYYGTIGDSTITISLESPTSAPRVARQVAVRAYPNPARGVLYFDLPTLTPSEGEAVLYDALGRVSRRVPLRRGQLDVVGLPAGVYLLRLQPADGGRAITRRVVVNR
ncbi:MAG: T9SS type A sorting domain-containing protein, partial [Catalinimonas sp.]